MVHVQAFTSSVSLVATDPEGLEIFISGPPRPIPSDPDAQLRSEEPLIREGQRRGVRTR